MGDASYRDFPPAAAKLLPPPELERVPPADDPEDEDEANLLAEVPTPNWQLKKLKVKHKQVASLLAQGARNVDIARMLGITPEYVHMLTKQPLVIAYIQEMCQHTGVRLESLFEKCVDVIADTMCNGTEAGKLKAARLQLEATKRIGRGEAPPSAPGSAEDRLLQLAQRLLFLQSGARRPGVYNEDGTPIEEAEFSEPGSGSARPEPAQTVRARDEEGLED